MDARIRNEVLKHRAEVLDREYALMEQVQKSLNGTCRRFVDIGCGPFGLLGRMGDRLANLKPNSIGIDLDRAALRNNENITHRICASCYSLPLESNSVDLIVCRWVFEHLEHPEQALKEFSRVLRKGGIVYVKTPNLWNYGMLISWATPTALHNAFLTATGFGENTPTFYRANTRRKLVELAANTGFKVRNLESRSGSYVYFAFNKELFLIMRSLSRLVSKATSATQLLLMCVLEKN
ncbi:MAG TPA: methyltransferase domain-containing protein [Bryobacteraceae bacterium]|nr:methyltransferase domain-containing protein [Bryobacteraceae bacterium]